MQSMLTPVAQLTLRAFSQRVCARSGMAQVGTALIGALFLQGCVTSQVPLLDEGAAVVEASFAGHYTYAHPTATNVDVYLKGKEFLIVENGKLRFISILNQWDTSTKTFIGQAREVGKRDYVYFLIQQTEKGTELNFFSCPFNCQATNMHDLSSMTSYDGEHLTATKVGDL